MGSFMSATDINFDDNQNNSGCNLDEMAYPPPPQDKALDESRQSVHREVCSQPPLIKESPSLPVDNPSQLRQTSTFTQSTTTIVSSSTEMELSDGRSMSISRSHRPVPTGNYLKLNLRKKCFSRAGTQRQNRARFLMKRAKFAKKFGGKGAAGGGRCFRCNQEGHWASKCPATIAERRSLKHMIPTAEELTAMDPDCAPCEWRIADLDELQRQFPAGPQLQELLNCDYATEHSAPVDVKKLAASLDPLEVRSCITNLLGQMGIRSFRAGQERVVWRTLAGHSTLLVLPTAGGKSLCYQIPAAVIQVNDNNCYSLTYHRFVEIFTLCDCPRDFSVDFFDARPGHWDLNTNQGRLS